MDEIIKSTYISHRNPLKMVDGLRQCYQCGQYKELSEFSISKSKGKIYYRPGCKPCVNDRSKKYQKDNYTKVQLSKRNTALKYTYGITLDQYNEMLADQNERCAICQRHYLEAATKRYLSLAVDHDRRCCGPQKACKKCIRQLLCTRCNRALGMFGDDIFILQAAIKYLTRHQLK